MDSRSKPPVNGVGQIVSRSKPELPCADCGCDASVHSITKGEAMKLIIDRGEDRAPIEVLPDVSVLDLEKYVDRAILIAALAKAIRTGRSGFTEQEIKEMFSGGPSGH